MRKRIKIKAHCIYKTDSPYKYYANSFQVKNAPIAILKCELECVKNKSFNEMKTY